MKILFYLAALVGLTVPAAAQSLASMSLANELGTVIGSEEACGLSFDQDAIAAFIESKVQADDMGFASNLSMMVMGQEYQLEEMSNSARTAHCTQIARVAKSYGFIE